MEIIKKENFDYLKLNFTEFFGNNATQWAWYNVPNSFRIKHWPEKPKLPVRGLDSDAPKTKITKLDSYGSIPFAHGEIYYCNWPQVVTKYGNRKMFLTTTWASPHEQTWMSHMFQLTKEGRLSPAILLASPIWHDRIVYYNADERVES